MNKVILIGNVTAKPEGREAGEHRLATFTLAVDRTRKDAGADFIPVQAWNKVADVATGHLEKGRQIAVDGRVRIDTYTTKEGDRRTRFVVVADTIRFLGSRKNGSGNGAAAAPAAEPEMVEVPF
jgi:single-strand DNA-binding protein